MIPTASSQSILRSRPQGTARAYSAHVNPQWVRLLKLLQMDEPYERCLGSELFTADGRRILDFLSGYCVHNAGHNHPAIVEALKDELDRCGPAMLQSHVPESAGLLAERLCERAGGGLEKVFFCSSGSEGIEAAIKFVRAHTHRTGLLYATGAFHGLTCGALSLMGSGFWSEGFGPMLAGTRAVRFGDLDALEAQLRSRQYAGLFLEPIQSEAGIQLPPAGYLKAAGALCRRYGTLLVMDEVQTGMYRTGPFLASHREGVSPDIVVLAKALSGGLVPCGAVLMTGEIYSSVYGSLRRAIVHTSTFSENGLAMRAGLATLDVLEGERLGERAVEAGEAFRAGLRSALSRYEMVEEVRGAGLLNGIAFRPPARTRLRVLFEAFRAIHPAMFGQVLVMRLFRDHNILAQICGNHFLVLKAAPPLIAEDSHLDEFVAAVDQVLAEAHESTGFWTEALRLARRAVNI